MSSQNVDLVTQSGEVHDLPLDSLLASRSPRLEGHSPDHVRVLAQAQTPLPPILVHRSSMQIIDGTHRVAAARLRGDSTISARFFDGDDREAFAMAVRANIAHGMPLTHADRVAAATEIARSYPNWSDRAVASVAGLSATTVADIRRRTAGRDEDPEAKRTGLDGRLRPVDPGAGRERVRQMIRKSPSASLRQLAKEAGVSPNTVRRVRKQLQEEPAPQVVEPPALPDAAKDAPTPTADTALRWLSQDPAVRQTESGRSAARWFFSKVVRPGEGENVIDALPPHTAHILAKVARQCASAWDELALALTARAREGERTSKAGS
ncbi:MAG: ParB N-terminal domain-containing protein [Umezawaea sp.]